MTLSARKRDASLENSSKVQYFTFEGRALRDQNKIFATLLRKRKMLYILCTSIQFKLAIV